MSIWKKSRLGHRSSSVAWLIQLKHDTLAQKGMAEKEKSMEKSEKQTYVEPVLEKHDSLKEITAGGQIIVSGVIDGNPGW